VQMQNFQSTLHGILDMIEDTDSAHFMTSPDTDEDNVTSLVSAEQDSVKSEDFSTSPSTFAVPLNNMYFPRLLVQ